MRPGSEILIIVNALSGGGAEKQVLLNASLLASAGYRCTLYALATRPPHPRIEELVRAATAAGVRVVREARPVAFSLRTFWQLAQHVAALSEFFVLWSWGYRAEIARLAVSVLNWRCRSVVSLRSAYREEIERMSLLWCVIDQQRPLYLSNSERNLRFLERICPGALGRGAVIYNCLEEAALLEPTVLLSRPSGPIRIAMLGNVRLYLKGYDYVVELAALLKQRSIPAKIVIGGMPHESERLRHLIRAAGVEDGIELVGAISRPFDFLREADAFLLMSRVEGMPNALLEAMAMGLPCIATRVGDVDRFATDGQHLRVVDVGDIEHVARILASWLEDWREPIRIGASARAHSREQFSPARMQQELTELFGCLQLGPIETL